MTTQFDSIYHGTGVELGKIRFAPVGIAWKALESEDNIMIQAGDIKYCQWLRVARNFQLRLILKENRRRETFDGFLREDHDKVSQLVTQHYKTQLETKEISVKGWNWGSTDVQGSDLAFMVGSRTAFEVPLRSVANSNIAGRTEVSLEFATAAPPSGQPKSKKGRPDELTEIRFYVPGTHEGEGDEDEDVSAAQAFHDMIKEKADIGQVIGDVLVSFSEVNIQTPRGRYDIDMFPTFLRLRGKTYDYKILYSSITRLFLLSPDDLHVEMVVGLDPPIRQGQTRYPYLRMLFGRDEDLETEIQMDEEQLKTKYEGKLEKKYDGPAHEVVSRIFRGLSGKKIIAPTTFRSHEEMYGIKCNLKAVQGTLFPLEKSLFFVAKQPHLIEFTDIHQVVFSRMGSGTARTFDLKIVSKTGPEVTFTSINKEEHDPIENYLTSKKVRTKNEMADLDLLGTAVGPDSDDDEMQSVASDGSERPKPRAMDSDDDSAEDEDFEASASDGGSPSEADSEVSDRMSIASGDLAIADDLKKKKKKEDGDAPKKAKKDKKEKKEKGGKKDKTGKKEEGPAKKRQKKNED
ncbi:FACT complex subunit POB3 [Rhizoctonia solani 123E]|uniref:FACT complex subunit POB3 n=1 Tax=Rhizoctonia solani 123E TaxID=1423351 RepID=A0A074S4L9_9AGAM|nr:FACT complex subunit POB3 [Rhizoctonia solani 123E]